MSVYIWSNDMVFELIDMVRERPVLWDSNLEVYRDRVKKRAAWRLIGEYFGVESSVVEKKMRMLTGQYRREQTKVAAGEISRWFAFNRLSFLSNVDTRTSRDNGFQNTIAGSDAVEENNLFDLEEEYSEDGTLLRKRPRIEVKNKHLLEMSSTDTLVKMFCDERNARDEFVVFGEYVANKLRNIADMQVRNTAQFHINNILYKAESGLFSSGKPAGELDASRLREEGKAAAWESESVASLPESAHSLDMDAVQVKVEKIS